MYKAILIVLTVLGLLATPCLAKNSRVAETRQARLEEAQKARLEERAKKPRPAMTRFDRMSKTELQQELKQLLTAFPDAVTSMKQAKEKAKEAAIAFRHAPEEEKYDALMTKLEAEAALGTQRQQRDKAKKDFRAAQKAYKNLLMFEKSDTTSDSAQQYRLHMKDMPLEALVDRLRELTGKTIIIDPGLDSEFTVKTTGKISATEMIGLLTETLASHNLHLEDVNSKTLRVRSGS